jgi:hypothetical protein
MRERVRKWNTIYRNYSIINQDLNLKNYRYNLMNSTAIKAMSFTNTKSFWVSIFDAYYHSAVELIENVRNVEKDQQ